MTKRQRLAAAKQTQEIRDYGARFKKYWRTNESFIGASASAEWLAWHVGGLICRMRILEIKLKRLERK